MQAALKAAETLPDGRAIAEAFARSLETARTRTAPYRHWLLDRALPDAVARSNAGANSSVRSTVSPCAP